VYLYETIHIKGKDEEGKVPFSISISWLYFTFFLFRSQNWFGSRFVDFHKGVVGSHVKNNGMMVF
jgi:hypothetical protein